MTKFLSLIGPRGSGGLLAMSVCFLLIVLSACDQPKPVARELPRVAPPPDSAGKSAANPDGQSPALGLPPVPAVVNSEPHLPQHAVLFNAFYKFVNDKGRVAKNVEELVATGYLTPLPPPPPGKKYLLNNQSLELKLVDNR